MKVFVGVLALAGLAAAGVVLDSEKLVEQPLAHSLAESGAQSFAQSSASDVQSAAKSSAQSFSQSSDVRNGAKSLAQSGAQSSLLSGLPTDVQTGAKSSAQSSSLSGLPTDVRTGVKSSSESSAQSGVHSGVQSGAQSGAQSSAQSGAHSGAQSGAPSGAPSGAQPVLASAVKPERPITTLNHLTFGLFGAPHLHHERRHEMGMMKKILEGPVMVAFYDVSPAVGGRMQAFLLPNGFEDITGYDREEIFPLIRYLTNGRRKSFLYPSAVNYLRSPEMFLPLRELHLPSYNLNTAFRISQDYSSLPYILISDDESLLTNNLKEKLDNLKEMGVFGLEKEGLKIVRDNYPRDNFDDLFAVVAHADPVRSVEYIVAVPTPVSDYAEEPRIRYDDKWFGLF